MTSPNVLSAIIRASRPTFRSREDRLAYAVHAFLLSDGYKLVAAGRDADEAAADADLVDDVPPDGWNSLDGTYAFRYVDADGKRPPLLVKALSMGNELLLHWTQAGPGSGGAEPHSLELPVDRFTADTSSSDPTAGYQHIDELVSELRKAFDEGGGSSGGGRSGAKRSATAVDLESAEALQNEAPDLHPARLPPEFQGDDPLRTDFDEPVLRRPGPPVYGVGAQDVVPPGFRAPGTGSGGIGIPGLEGGGSYLGPTYIGVPAPGRGGPVPGARWDPIRPPGLEGFNPGDFQQPGRRGVHPDIQPPGPGRGVDFDNMFG